MTCAAPAPAQYLCSEYACVCTNEFTHTVEFRWDRPLGRLAGAADVSQQRPIKAKSAPAVTSAAPAGCHIALQMWRSTPFTPAATTAVSQTPLQALPITVPDSLPLVFPYPLATVPRVMHLAVAQPSGRESQPAAAPASLRRGPTAQPHWASVAWPRIAPPSSRLQPPLHACTRGQHCVAWRQSAGFDVPGPPATWPPIASRRPTLFLNIAHACNRAAHRSLRFVFR